MKDIIVSENNKKITLNKIKKFRTKYNIEIDKEYEKFLLDKNGGFINLGYVIFLDSKDRDNYIHTVEFYDFERLKEILNIDLEDRNNIDCMGHLVLNEKMLRIGESNLGFDLCLSYSKDNFGKIYYIDDPHENEFIFLANSFDELINRFEECPERLF